MNIITVITPFYKGNAYLPQLCGVLEENARRLAAKRPESSVEWILVNDSPDIQMRVPQSDVLTVHALCHESNQGIHAARVTGLQHASGDFILFLDQDDEISPDFFAKTCDAIGDADVAVANAWIEQANGSKKLLYRNEFQYRKITRMEVYAKTHNQIASPGQCLLRRTAIPEFWIRHILRTNGSDDLFLWLLMLGSRNRFVIIHEALYTHQYTGTNLSAEVEKMDRSTLEVCSLLTQSGTVPCKIVKDLRRSRQMSQEWEQGGLVRRAKAIISNLDILVPAAFWKIKSSI